MSISDTAIKAPSAFFLMAEGRSVFEMGAYFATKPLFRHLKKGDGHPVLVLPGLAASDFSTVILRRFLKKRGYQPYGWKQGRNLGLRDRVLENMLAKVDEIFDIHGEKLSLVGWSLGGIFARELAKLRPEKIRFVISLGSPHSGNPKASHATRFYEYVSGHSVKNPPLTTVLSEAPPVPTTSIYSKTDGVVAWQNCHQRKPVTADTMVHTENIRVEGSHCGLGVNPSVLYILADRLAQDEKAWKPFANKGVRKIFFRIPQHDVMASH
ncbi:MAG TPA: alpha/beta hydrolase [Hellea balneolensis]|uniref:Alpha/beta hydrolase n=1 Tax=Hellea balneolensis TaxID=287478 RepID=A0A7C3C9I2_9PROT|nr:alpha/beta hydrolase [Hellea balneolensis]